MQDQEEGQVMREERETMSGAGADRGSRGRLALAVRVAAVTTAACLALAMLASTASALLFNANLLVSPVSAASDSPSGLDVTLSIEQTGGAEELAAAELKDSTVTLPPGMTLDPSAANGLEACTEEEFGLHTEAQPDCPAASAVGTVAINTLLLEHPNGAGTANVTGTIYVGSQESDEPESGKMYRIYMAVNNYQRGILVKLEGSVSANKETGQLTTSFIETPQLPFASLYLHFNSGPNAALATPVTCGSGRLRTSRRLKLSPRSSSSPARTASPARARRPNAHSLQRPSPAPQAPPPAPTARSRSPSHATTANRNSSTSLW
jgi:hypothetical protein